MLNMKMDIYARPTYQPPCSVHMLLLLAFCFAMADCLVRWGHGQDVQTYINFPSWSLEEAIQQIFTLFLSLYRCCLNASYLLCLRCSLWCSTDEYFQRDVGCERQSLRTLQKRDVKSFFNLTKYFCCLSSEFLMLNNGTLWCLWTSKVKEFWGQVFMFLVLIFLNEKMTQS